MQVEAILLRIQVTYFISLFDLRVWNKLLVIPGRYDRRNNLLTAAQLYNNIVAQYLIDNSTKPTNKQHFCPAL